MKHLTFVCFVVTMACSNLARATDPPQRHGATRPLKVIQPDQAVPAKQDKMIAPEQLKPATRASRKPATQTPRRPPARRAVYQQLDDQAVRGEAPAIYAPQLAPRIDVAPAPAQAPAPPVTLNCVGAACLDAGGGSYRGGVGTSLINPQGRICNNNGITVQCH